MYLPQRPLLKTWMQLDLIHGRYDTCLADDALQVIGREVRDTDRRYTALLSQFDQSPPSIHISLALRTGPVNEVEIDDLEPELDGAKIEGAQRLVISLVFVPELRCHVELVPRQGALLEGPSNARFIPVIRGGVDQTIAGIDRGSDDLRRLFVIHPPDPKTELGDAMAVIEGDAWHLGSGHHYASPGLRGGT